MLNRASLPLSPLQLRAEHVEEISISAKQADAVLGAAATDSVTIAQIKAGLTVQTKICDIFIAMQ